MWRFDVVFTRLLSHKVVMGKVSEELLNKLFVRGMAYWRTAWN